MRFRRTIALAATATLALTVPLAGPAAATPSTPSGPTASGYGGAVSTVDATATAVGLDVLRRGGNAVDAAIAAAATLGVTEPFSAGIGGGGFFVYYDAKHRKVHTIDGRESGPASMTEKWFIDPADGLPYDFQEARVSGLSVGTPGTLATWESAARKWGSKSLGSLLQPAARVADRGFPVDATFRQQVTDNAAAFGQFESTSDIYLPGGVPPAVGSTLRNPDLADTYRLIAQRGTGVFYNGAVGRDIVRTVQQPPVAEDPIGEWAYPIRGADLRMSDLANYKLRYPAPTKSGYRGLHRLRHVHPVQRRHRGRRGAEHPGEDGPVRGLRDPGAAPVPGGHRAVLRGPQPVRRRVHPAVAVGPADQRPLGRSARLPDRPGEGTGQAGPARRHQRPGLHSRGRRRPGRGRARAPPTSPWPTSGATSSSTRSPSSRPAAAASSCRAAGSCSTTS